MKLVVLSCDKYDYCWGPFFKLLEKYYPNHPECYLITETKQCSFCKTININTDIWTKRVREGLEQIDDDEVIIMLEDFFIRQPVDENRINSIKLDQNTAVYNFETNYREAIPFSNEWSIQKNNQIYLNSCQPSLWNKKVLIDRLQLDQSPWEWELTVINSPLKHFINNNSLIIDVGTTQKGHYGITRGEVTKECNDFFKKEKLNFNPNQNIKLSIITPYYNTLKYIQKLSQVLLPQLTNEVEWIIVDDGCKENQLDQLSSNTNVQIYHIETSNCHVGIPRNFGLDQAQGQYVAWIDSDDLVSDNYISTLLNKINSENFDYCYISWQWLNGGSKIIIDKERPSWNCSSWSVLYKYDKIKNIRFDETLRIAEDYKFHQEFLEKNKNLIQGKSITDLIYYYNTGRSDSLMSTTV